MMMIECPTDKSDRFESRKSNMVVRKWVLIDPVSSLKISFDVQK